MKHLAMLIAPLLMIAGAQASTIQSDDEGDVFVVRASGPSARQWHRGDPLGLDERIVLRRGDRLTVARGRFAREFRGPGEFIAGDFTTPAGRTVPQPPPEQPWTGPGPRPVPERGPPDSHISSTSRFILCPNDRRCPR